MEYKVLERFTAYSFYCIDCQWQWMKKINILTRCVKCNSKNTVGPPKQRVPAETRVLSQSKARFTAGYTGEVAMNMSGKTALST